MICLGQSYYSKRDNRKILMSEREKENSVKNEDQNAPR